MKLQQEISKIREEIASKISSLSVAQLSDVLFAVNAIAVGTESINEKMYKLFNENKVLLSFNEKLHDNCNELREALKEAKWERDRLRKRCSDLEEYNQNVSESLKQKNLELTHFKKVRSDSASYVSR